MSVFGKVMTRAEFEEFRHRIELVLSVDGDLSKLFDISVIDDATEFNEPLYPGTLERHCIVDADNTVRLRVVPAALSPVTTRKLIERFCRLHNQAL